MFLGIWDKTAKPVIDALPATQSKEDSIQLEAQLPNTLNWPTIWPNVNDKNAIRAEVRHGRNNLIVGNEYFEKAKGTFR